MYGAPVWHDKLVGPTVTRKIICGMQKQVTIKVIGGYRTISYEIACLLSRLPPWTMVATKYARIHSRIFQAKENGILTNGEIRAIKKEEHDSMLREWRSSLDRNRTIKSKTKDAIVASFEGWIRRVHGGMNFHLTQIFTNHGCFREYLCRIGKMESPKCLYCENTDDSGSYSPCL